MQTEAADELPPPALPSTPPEAKSSPRRRPTRTASTRTAKLSALHSRLSLPAKLPLQTLTRCLIDASADQRQAHNNASMAVIGQDLLAFFTAEHLMVHYPRLPMAIMYAAQYAYSGPATLAAMRAEWGVDTAAYPGPEVDPGLLQFERVTPGNALAEDGQTRLKDMPGLKRMGSGRKNEEWNYRRGMSSRIVYDDEFGDLRSDVKPYPGAPISKRAGEGEGEADGPSQAAVEENVVALQAPAPIDELPSGIPPVTLEAASATFIRALAGAIHLHAGFEAVKKFHRDFFLSRHLELHKLFNFPYPTRDVSRLCAREGFEPPVARLISETGRLSRSPVFVVGVFSGEDKLGEAAGASLNEGRVRAAAAALRAWYLYSPPVDNIIRPSDMEAAAESGNGKKKQWRPQMVDPGEIVT